jgi:hypothetical protein
LGAMKVRLPLCQWQYGRDLIDLRAFAAPFRRLCEMAFIDPRTGSGLFAAHLDSTENLDGKSSSPPLFDFPYVRKDNSLS